MFKKLTKVLVYTVLIAALITAMVVSYQYKINTDSSTFTAIMFALHNGLLLTIPVFIAGEIMEG